MKTARDVALDLVQSAPALLADGDFYAPGVDKEEVREILRSWDDPEKLAAALVKDCADATKDADAPLSGVVANLFWLLARDEEDGPPVEYRDVGILQALAERSKIEEKAKGELREAHRADLRAISEWIGTHVQNPQPFASEMVDHIGELLERVGQGKEES